MSNERCELSDMPVEWCACRIHAPKVSPPEREWGIVARFPARFNSECDRCGGAMDQGDPIARTTDGDYICEACFPPAPDPFAGFL